ncbi:hypothetical protein LOCC1_G006545 [Lachnellula occidentalis]|uniref:Uncharacterized protein n=1 Tax=Lachnellula occidentalis TaxID=215460 RepID=A0A8H8U9K5_9HELO|nr:hypothetical protein LOCC1_G006545 [Lachnellula occidentalis]
MAGFSTELKTIATPHRGSSYLSMTTFSEKIQEILSLKGPIPRTIAQQLQLDNGLLREMDSNFKALATDLHIWSFFETKDSNLTNTNLIESARFPFHAPITSIKSALLNLRHEIVYPLLSDHASCASFDSNNTQTKTSYLSELAHAVKKACELSKTKHTDMRLEDKVQVEINGFYEGTVLLDDSQQPPIRVWSTNRSLTDFRKLGPAKLLEERLAEVSVAPPEAQHLRHDTRAVSLLPDKIRDTRKAPPDPAFNGPSTSLRIPPRKPSSTRQGGRLLRSKSKERAAVSSVHQNAPSTNPDAINSAPEPTSPRKSISMFLEEIGPIPPPANAHAVTTPGSLPTPVVLEPTIDAGLSIDDMDKLRRNSEVQTQPFLLLPDLLHRESVPRGRRGSESAVSPSSQVTFTRPDVSNRKLVWVHVPFNNPIWVKNILEAISVEKGPNHHDKLLSIENWESRHVRGRHAEHHACFVKPGCPPIEPEIRSPSASPRGSPRGEPVQMCLYLPFLHFDTYKALVKRRTLIKQRIKQGRSRPVPSTISKLKSLELKVLWQFLGHDPPINCRRTLDQFGYPGLLDTRARDDDQMLYKMTKQRSQLSKKDRYDNQMKDNEGACGEFQGDSEENPEVEDDNDNSDDNESGSEEEPDEELLDGNVLMVDQVWLWIVDKGMSTHSAIQRETLITDGRLYQQADLRNSLFNEVNADLTSRCENSFDLAALVALHAVTVLFERSSHPDLEIFRIFEEAISILTEKMTTSFKRFRARGFRDKATDYDSTVRTTNIREKHKREGALAEKQNRENTSALLELRDIEDELKTLETLFGTQQAAIHDMIANYESNALRGFTGNALGFLYQARAKLNEYLHHTSKMIKSVQSTRDDFDKLLQMVQRQAQVDEVRLARLQADLASAQSRSVMIFTVFTVIFLPLTFFTGLFGMNTREWGGGSFLPLRTIGSIALPSSFVIITLALVVAWSTRMRRLLNFIARSIIRGGGGFLQWLRNMGREVFVETMHWPRVPTSTSTEKRSRKQKRTEEPTSWLDEGDFWGEHGMGREKDYMLPPQNRRSVRVARRKGDGGKG